MADQIELFQTLTITETLAINGQVSLIFERIHDEDLVNVFIGFDKSRSLIFRMKKTDIQEFIKAVMDAFNNFSLEKYEAVLYNLNDKRKPKTLKHKPKEETSNHEQAIRT